MSARTFDPARAVVIPEPMRGACRWVCWRYEDHGKPKLDKVPVNPKTGRRADSTDRSTWGTYDQAVDRFERDPGLAGIGFVLGDKWLGVDLDGCVNGSREPEPWARRIVDDLASYAELSPNDGLHVIGRGELPAGCKHVVKVNGGSKLEVYDGNRFLTFTGNALDALNLGEVIDLSGPIVPMLHRYGMLDGEKPNGEARAGTLDLPATPPAPLPAERVAALIENDPGFASTWNLQREDFARQDGSPDLSSYDLSIANTIAALDWPPVDAWAAIIAFRDRHGTKGDRAKARRRDYIEGHTLAKAYAGRTATGEAERCGTAQAQGWPEPLDIIGAPELTGWPVLTEECLPAPLYRYVTAEAERLGVDPCPLAAHVLAACAASISDAWRIKPKRHDHWTQQARLWVCVVKDVGARGTEMIRSAFWPVRERDKTLFDDWRREHATWKKRQEATKKDKKGRPDDDPEPKCRRLVSQDATIEAASEILSHGDDHAKLTLLHDELVAFLGGFARYSPSSSTARALWLESYDGGPQHVDRIKRGHVYVPNWSVVIAGNIQPRRLAAMARDLIDDGLFQRFLVVHTRPADLGTDDDKPLSTDIGRDYRDLHAALAVLEPARGADEHPMPAWLQDDGHAERRRFMRLVERLQIDPTLPIIIRETAPKWSGLLARLALIFHVVELAEQQRQGAVLEPHEFCRINCPSLHKAATLLRRIALPNLFRLGFETMDEGGDAAGHARWIAGYLLAHKAETITASQIGRAHRPLRGRRYETHDAMTVLCDAGWTTPGKEVQGSMQWHVNPAVHARFAEAAEAERERRERIKHAICSSVSDL